LLVLSKYFYLLNKKPFILKMLFEIGLPPPLSRVK